MNKNNVTFRLERKEDYRKVEELVRNSFYNVYRPGCSEHYVLHQLRNHQEFVKELDIVMEKDGQIIGQNVFVKTMIHSDHGKDIPVLTMGPISIRDDLKRQGYGKILLDYSLSEAKRLGYGAVLIEGNIDFYGHSGFQYASDYHIRYPDFPKDEKVPFFLCKELIPDYLHNVKGDYVIPDGYFVDEKDVEEFDENFEYKEKLKLPGQLF